MSVVLMIALQYYILKTILIPHFPTLKNNFSKPSSKFEILLHILHPHSQDEALQIIYIV